MWSSVTCFFYLAQWLKAGGEDNNKGWDGWMASPTQWTWVLTSSGSWWWTGKSGMLLSMGHKESNMTQWMNWTDCSLVALTVKNLSAMWETQVWYLSQKEPLEKGMATYSSILAWRIPWTEETGGPQSMRSQGVGRDWATNNFTF